MDTRPARSEQGAKQEPVLAISVEPVRSRWKLAALAGIGAAAAGTIAVFGVTRNHASPPAAATTKSPMLAAGSILACPQLSGRVGSKPAGWLGAAAASIACTRAQARMGGHSARVLVPAELLDLPRAPVDQFPVDAYEGPHARERAIAAARSAAAWLDGEIVRDHDSFHVELVLRATGDGRVVGRGVGDDPAILDAVRGAMAAFENTALPGAPDDDPFLVQWQGARTADAAVAIADLSFVNMNGDIQTECPRIRARSDLTPLARKVIDVYCTKTRALPPGPMPARDTSTPGALRLSVEADAYQDLRPLDADLALLDAALAKTSDHEERALLLAEKSAELSSHRDVDRATEAGLASIHEDPKVLDSYESAWVTLSWLRPHANLPAAATAWHPWSTEAYCMEATRSPDPARKIEATRRDHILSPPIPGAYDGWTWTANLVDFLVQGGKPDEARAVASEAPDPGFGTLLEASEARFGKALAIAAHAEATATDPFHAFWSAGFAGVIATIAGKPLAGTDALVDKYLANLDPGAILLHYHVLRACVLAPHDAAKRCLARLHDVVIVPLAYVPGLLEGADKFVDGDWAGAALAWRPMLAHPNWQLDGLRDVVAIAFERAGDDDLVEQVDAPLLARTGEWNGAELAYVRAARRAERKKDFKAARIWAEKVIKAWDVADIPVPAVAEMRKLVARLP